VLERTARPPLTESATTFAGPGTSLAPRPDISPLGHIIVIVVIWLFRWQTLPFHEDYYYQCHLYSARSQGPQMRYAPCMSVVCPMLGGCQASVERRKVGLDRPQPDVTQSGKDDSSLLEVEPSWPRWLDCDIQLYSPECTLAENININNNNNAL